MAHKLEFVGTIQFWPSGVRGNPIALFMEKAEDGECRIGARLPEWQHIIGVGATVNKAAGNYELTLRAAVPTDNAYEGPHWNAGIKAEKPAPPKPAAAPSATGGNVADAPPASAGTPQASSPPSV